MTLWKRAEDVVRKELEAEFVQQFKSKKIVAGSKPRSFDLVSHDGTIVAQVKSCAKKFEALTAPQIKTRFQRDYIFDCLLLTRIQADKRLFFLVADPKLSRRFVEWAEGLVPGVEIRHIDVSSL